MRCRGVVAAMNENKTAGPLTVIVERAGNNWCAHTPDDIGVVVATGQTRPQTIENFRVALRTHLEVMQEDGLPTPDVTELEIRETVAV